MSRVSDQINSLIAPHPRSESPTLFCKFDGQTYEELKEEIELAIRKFSPDVQSRLVISFDDQNEQVSVGLL